jgi:hypothetical protein
VLRRRGRGRRDRRSRDRVDFDRYGQGHDEPHLVRRPPVLGWALPCSGAGDSSNLAGEYTFSDSAATTLDAAADAAGTSIPPGEYQGDSALAAFAGQAPAGPWIFTFEDRAQLDLGSVSAISITINGFADSYDLTQAAPGSPVVIASRGGIPGGYYLHAFTLSAPPYFGWFFGLPIAIQDLAAQISFGAPFFGALDGNGEAVFSIPGVPPGLTIGTVAVHFDPTGYPVIGTGAIPFTTM